MILHFINRITEVTGVAGPKPISLVAPAFEGYSKRWLEKRTPQLHPGTVSDYGSQLRNHLVPRWGSYPLTEIRTLEIRAWVDELRGGDLSGRTVRNLYGLLRNVLSEAQADELIAANPCCLKGQHLPENVSREANFGERHVFTRDELLRIIDHPAIPIRSFGGGAQSDGTKK